MKPILLLGLVFFTPSVFAEDDLSANEPVHVCADYSAPVCAYGQKTVVVKDGYGCEMPICSSPVHDDEEFQPMGCPTLAVPTCGKNQDLVHHTDFNRCPYSLCEDKK